MAVEETGERKDKLWVMEERESIYRRVSIAFLEERRLHSDSSLCGRAKGGLRFAQILDVFLGAVGVVAVRDASTDQVASETRSLPPCNSVAIEEVGPATTRKRTRPFSIEYRPRNNAGSHVVASVP